MTRAYIGIGSNLGDSAGIVRDAFERVRALGTNYVNSDLYYTEPWGNTEQPAFVNAVAAFDTNLDARALLMMLRDIEAQFGRQRTERWGPRTLDLDLLMFGDSVANDAECTIPHPHMRERAFVLEPLAEIAPDLRVPPEGKTVSALLASLPQQDRACVRRLRGTANLAAPSRLDYDTPGGAGERYHELRPFSVFDVAVLDAVLRATGPLDGKRVLDVGCGTGRFTERIAGVGAHVVGLDPSDTMLSTARSRSIANNGTIDYVTGDANRSLPGGPYDAVTAFYCAQYLDAVEFAKRAHAQLGEGGVLAIASFPHRHFAEVLFSRFFPSLAAIDMARFPSVPALKRALQAAKFEDIESKDVTLELEDNAAALIERVEKKYLSSFFLLDDREFREGVAAMRAAWRDTPVVSRIAQAVVVSGRATVPAAR
jgi:2-amino-4-hydroxy-6-hydroxymethyldihydropteridine diphosphokinase